MGRRGDIVIEERTISPASSRHSHHSHHSRHSRHSRHHGSRSKGHSYTVYPNSTSGSSSSSSDYDSGYESDRRREHERELALLRRERHKARRERKERHRAGRRETEVEGETNVLKRVNKVGLKEGLFGAASGTAGLLFLARNLAKMIKDGDGTINKRGPLFMGGGSLTGFNARRRHNNAKGELAVVSSKTKKTKKSRSRRESESD